MTETVDNADAEIKRLHALARQRCTDEWIEGHDEVNEDGDKIAVVPDEGPAGTKVDREVNLSKMFQSAPSRTSRVDILTIEAELVADGHDPDNPHIPSSVDVLEEACDQISAAGHTPAWEVVFDD